MPDMFGRSRSTLGSISRRISRAGAMSALVALTTLLGIELLRAFPALAATRVDVGGERIEWVRAGLVVAPFLVAAVATTAWVGRDPRRGLLTAGTLLAAARVFAQVVDGELGAVAAGIGLAGALVALGVLAVIGLPLFGGGVLAGAGLAAAVRVALGSRDLVWIDGPAALAAVAVTAGWYVILLRRRTRRDVVVLGRNVGAGVALLGLGPALLLESFVLTNLGWVAPALDRGWLGAATIIGLGSGAGVGAAAVAAARPDGRVQSLGLIGSLAVCCAAAAMAAPGIWWGPVVILAQAGVAVLLTAASARGAGTGATRGAMSAVAVAPLFLLAAVIALDGRGVLGFDVRPSAAIVASGAVLVVASLAVRRLPAPLVHNPGWRHVPSLAGLFVLPAALLLAGLPLLVRIGSDGHVGESRELRVVTYNVALGFDGSGALNVDEVLVVLDDADPDVVALQEVPRGFLPAAGIDVLGYLQRALGLPHLTFQPSAPGALHGNAVLSRYPIRTAQLRSFARDGTALPRGVIAATIDVPVGDDVVVMAAHLPPGGTDAARDARTRALVALWGGRPRTVLALDANAAPDSATIEALVDAGFVLPDDPTPTFPSSRPLSRIDYVLHTEDLEVVTSSVPDSDASDHLPVVTVLRPAGLV
jgi:endonuclease/exonuclease/phosphatase family metal-dependent hydrolase